MIRDRRHALVPIVLAAAASVAPLACKTPPPDPTGRTSAADSALDCYASIVAARQSYLDSLTSAAGASLQDCDAVAESYPDATWAVDWPWDGTLDPPIPESTNGVGGLGPIPPFDEPVPATAHIACLTNNVQIQLAADTAYAALDDFDGAFRTNVVYEDPSLMACQSQLDALPYATSSTYPSDFYAGNPLYPPAAPTCGCSSAPPVSSEAGAPDGDPLSLASDPPPPPNDGGKACPLPPPNNGGYNPAPPGVKGDTLNCKALVKGAFSQSGPTKTVFSGIRYPPIDPRLDPQAGPTPANPFPGYAWGESRAAYSAEPDFFMMNDGYIAVWPKADEMPELTRSLAAPLTWKVSLAPTVSFVPLYIPNPKSTGPGDRWMLNTTNMKFFVAKSGGDDLKFAANCTDPKTADSQQVKMFVDPNMKILFSAYATISKEKGPGRDRFKPKEGWSEGYTAEVMAKTNVFGATTIVTGQSSFTQTTNFEGDYDLKVARKCNGQNGVSKTDQENLELGVGANGGVDAKGPSVGMQANGKWGKQISNTKSVLDACEKNADQPLFIDSFGGVVQNTRPVSYAKTDIKFNFNNPDATWDLNVTNDKGGVQNKIELGMDLLSASVFTKNAPSTDGTNYDRPHPVAILRMGGRSLGKRPFGRDEKKTWDSFALGYGLTSCELSVSVNGGKWVPLEKGACEAWQSDQWTYKKAILMDTDHTCAEYGKAAGWTNPVTIDKSTTVCSMGYVVTKGTKPPVPPSTTSIDLCCDES